MDTYPVLPAFPAGTGKNDVRTEMLLGSLGWTDVSTFVEEITDQLPSRGKPDESTSNTPGQLGLTLNNADGRFFDGNPLGPYYGNLGRNTPIRLSVPEGATYLRLRDDTASYVAGPTAMSNTGDVDVRIDVTLDNWRASQQLAGKWSVAPNQSYALLLTQAGFMQLQYSTTGSNTITATATAPVPVPAGRRQLLRFTYNHTTGQVDFYYAAAQSLGGLTSRSAAWVHLGNTITTGTSGNIFGSTAAAVVGNVANQLFGSAVGMTGKFHAAEFRTGSMPQRTGTGPPLLSAANGGTLTWAANPSAGNKVLVAVWTTTAETITSVADNGTTPVTFTLDKTVTNGTHVVSVYRGDSITLPASGSYAVTVTGTGGAIVVAAGQAYTGVQSGAPAAGASTTNTGTGTAVSTGLVTASDNTAALYFSVFTDASALAAETITLTGTGFTQVTNAIQNNGSTSLCGSAADRIDSGGATTAQDTWTLGDSVAWAALVVMYPMGNGSTKGSPDFTAQPPGTTNFNDAQANNWQLNGTAVVTDRHYRFWGETSAFPTSWNLRGTHVPVSLQASGILRRLTQSAGSTPFKSALRRAWPGLPDLIGYWPCEDGNSQGFGSTNVTPTSFAPATPNTPIGTYQGGPPEFASDASFQASLPIPTLNGSTWNFSIPQNHAADVGNILRFLVNVPPAGEPATFVGSNTTTVPLVTLFTGGTVAKLVFGIQGGAQAGGANTGITTQIAVTAYNAAGTQLNSAGSSIACIQGVPVWVSVEMYQSGGNVQIAYGIQIVGETFVAYNGYTVVGTLGSGTQIVVNSAGTLQQTSVGQITYQRQFHDMSLGEFSQQISAWIGELAGNRFQRLCSEQGIPFYARGNLADTQPMGAQTTIDVMSLLQECVDADRGMWWEPPWALALGYRTLADLLNQPPVASIPYAASSLSDGLASNEDDQFTINDATVVNTYTGGSAEVAVTSGPLSNQSPPNGVNSYLAQPQINLANDWQCADEAGWITWVGTAPDLRFPATPFHMSRQSAANFFALQEADVGDRLQIVTPAANGAAPANTAKPAWLSPSSQTSYARGGIDILVNNLATALNVKKYDVTITGVPATPYLCAQADDPVHGHLGAANSSLDGYTPAANTNIAVTTPYDFLHNVATDPWTTKASDFPFDVGISGEQITVNSATGPPAVPVTSDAANPPQIAITPGATASVIYGAVVNPTNSTAFTAGASTVFSQNVSDATNARAYGTFSSAPTTKGTPITVGGSAPAVAGLITVAEFLSVGGITEDASSPAGVSATGGKTVTTASFTPPAGALVLAQVAANGTAAISMAVTNTGTLGAWTQLAGDGRNQATLWITRVTASPTAVTVTATASGANSANGIALTVKVLDNAAGRLGAQAMAVVRAQNGISKNLTSGSPVDLYTIPALSL